MFAVTERATQRQPVPRIMFLQRFKGQPLGGDLSAENVEWRRLSTLCSASAVAMGTMVMGSRLGSE